MLGVMVIVRRRHSWTGCQWLFWTTIALGLMMSAIGLVSWTADEILIGRETSWLGWHAVFGLFGSLAPLLALLAQPHRGPREAAAATTAVDIAGIAVLSGFLYSYFVVAQDGLPVAGQTSPLSLLMLSELQQFIVAAGMTVAALVARRFSWGPTYRRLATGALVSFVTLTLSNAEIWHGAYRAGFVYDFTWILPFAFYPWAVAAAPASNQVIAAAEDQAWAPSRPWLIFGALCLIPIIDYALRRALPQGPFDAFRDLSTVVTIVSVFPLLMARLAVERAELRESDSNLRLLGAAVQQSEELISIATHDGRFHHANAAFCRALDYELSELRHLPAEALLADERGNGMADIQTAIRRDGVWRGSLMRRRKDGSTFPSSCTVVPLEEDSRITHFVAVERDVSEELRVREQLVETERLSAVGQMAAGVAHEINNPLQSILGYSELLLGRECTPAARHDLEQVRSQATRAGGIVRNILAFARRASTARTLEDINEVVRSTVALADCELARANIELKEHYSAGLAAVFINRGEIQQVVLNLLLNAEQAIRKEDVGTTVSVRTLATNGSVAVEVSDDGPGIPTALRSRIFEPFFTTKEVGEGTGLGLSVALGIAEAHGGLLSLVPSDHGSCFRLRLPAADAAHDAAPNGPPSHPIH
jgi:PAS domain S-box-containing protein